MSVLQKLLAKLGIAFGLASAVLLAFYTASGQSVDSDGNLVEEFWALALGSASLIASGTFGASYFVIRTITRSRSNLGS